MAQDIGFKKIEDFLLSKHLLDENTAKAIDLPTISTVSMLEDTLVAKKVFSSKQFNEIKGQIFNIPAVDLDDYVIDAQTLNLLTLKVSQNYKMVVFERQGNEIKVGMVSPGDFQAHEAMEFLVGQQGLKAKYFSISSDDFKEVVKQYGDFKKEIGSALKIAQEKFSHQEEIIVESKDDAQLESVIKAAPVAKIVSVIIKHAVEGKASDIHIEPGRNEARVRYRVDGILRNSLSLPTYLHQAVVSRIKVLSNLKLDETRIPQDGRIRMNVDNQDIDLRVSVLPMLDAEKVVLRILDNSAGVPSLAELGFSPRHIEIIERNITKPHGLCLLTGPTGSGKTTTLYSVLNMINSEAGNINTLEDPVEYYITGINQSQVKPDLGFTFAKGLRAILRQDPNIIMVGEIRDNETAELVIHAALTGHLVFSTLHTNNAWGAVPRLIDMKVEPFLLSSTLNIIIAQRLVRRVCPECKEPINLPDNLKKRYDEEIARVPEEAISDFKDTRKFYRGKGCNSCGNSGYTGRVVICEILEVGNELRELIAGSFTMEQVEVQLKKQKHISLSQDGIIKALQGVTTIEEVMRVANE